MIPQDVLRALVKHHNVSETEFAVLHLAMAGKSMPDIARELNIDSAAVRKRLGEVYRKFGIVGKGPGKLPKLQQLLVSQYQEQQEKSQPDSAASIKLKETSIPQLPLWDGILEIDSFYGRLKELATLEQWIVVEHCRLIELLGIGGIGKTTLAQELAKRIRDRFDKVVYRSLSHAPSLKETLADLLQFLADGEEDNLPENLQDRVSHLLFYMRRYRCLLILDGAESILQRDELAGSYQEGYQEYSTLLRQIAETEHQSCLIVTSGEKTQEFAALEGKKVRAFHLHGLKEVEAQAIFKEKGIFAETEQDWQMVIRLYGGNPLALKIACVTIQEVFGGSLSEFLKQGTTVFGGISSLIEQQFNRLSSLEKHIVYWLAINGEPVSLQQLRQDMMPPVSHSRLLEALESLGQRSLVERDKALFSLQPVVMEYITDRLVERVCEELVTGNIRRFNRYALIKAEAKDYIRERQIQLVLQPLIEKLLIQFENEAALKQRLLQLLAELRQAPLRPGYAAGNLLNLLGQLDVDVSNCDFSHLTLRQAYLKQMPLHGVDFTGADLATSVFAERLGSILSIAFSPDGKRLATGDTGNMVRLWDAVTGEQLVTCQGHEDWVRAVVFSPDGQILGSGSEDQTVRLWNVSTGQCLHIFEGHRSWIRSVTFSSDGRLLASGSDDRTIRLWDLSTGLCLNLLEDHMHVVRSVAFSPDNQMLASGSSDRTIRLWQVTTGECLRILKHHARGVRSVRFSPDGKRLASGSADCTVKMWDVATGDCLQTFSGHLGWVLSVTFSPDGQILASGSKDQTVRLWQLSTGICLATLHGHTSWVRSVRFSPDGKQLASGSDDQSIRLWDVATGRQIKTLQGYARGIRSVVFSPNGQTLASGSEDCTVRIWNLATAQCLLTLSGHAGHVWSVAFSPNGRILASGSEDHLIRLWDTNTGECLKILSGHDDGIRSVTFSPNGRLLASGGSDQIIRLWDVITGQCLDALTGHTEWVWSVAFSPDGRILASGGSDLTVRLWDVQTRQCLNVLQGHHHWIRSVAFSPDGQTLASSSVGRTVRLWDIKTGKCLKTLEGYKSGVRSVAFSPDSRLLASGSDDWVVRIWDIQSGQCVQALQGHTDLVRSVAFSQDGKTLASGSMDEAIKLWDVATGEELKTLKLPRLYEGMKITDALNLTLAQRITLIALGAIDEHLPC